MVTTSKTVVRGVPQLVQTLWLGSDIRGSSILIQFVESRDDLKSCIFLPLIHAFQRSAGRQKRGDTVEWRLRRERGTARARDRAGSEKEEGMSQTALSYRASGRVEHVAREFPMAFVERWRPAISARERTDPTQRAPK